MRTIRKITLSTVFFLVFCSGLFAARFTQDAYGFSLYLPDGWSKNNLSEDSFFAFSNDEGDASISVWASDDDSKSSAVSSLEALLVNIDPEAHAEAYVWENMDAAFSQGRSLYGEIDVHYITVFIIGPQYRYLINAAGSASGGKQLVYEMASCVDSFCLGETGLNVPGPVSQYHYPLSSQVKEERIFSIDGNSYQIDIDPRVAVLSQKIIEREASLLMPEDRFTPQAWERYYRMIYRHNYRHLREIAAIIQTRTQEMAPRQKAEYVMKWLQEFSYSRNKIGSDLLNPIDVVLDSTGDCDALGLVYCIIMGHLGIDSVLFVSSEYDHAVAGAAVEADGARMQVDGVPYYVVELTDSVGIGLIDQNKADPGKWQAVSFE